MKLTSVSSGRTVFSSVIEVGGDGFGQQWITEDSRSYITYPMSKLLIWRCGMTAKKSLRIEREKYDLGKGTILDVLDAQSALLDAQTNYYRALADLHIARASLALATGAQP